MRKICFMLLSLAVSTSLCAQRVPQNFRWGINGHPLTQAAYAGNWDDQMAHIKDLGLNSYRFDVLLNADGHAKKEGLFLKVLNDLASNKVSALTVLSLSGLKGLTTDAIYQKTFQQGTNFAARYGKMVPYVEINNEVDNKIMHPGNRRGDKATDYDTAKTARILTGIKGFVDGLKSQSPDIKVTLSISYIHFYYLTLLDQYQVKYDIIGCHWYSNMGDVTNFGPTGRNILTYFKEKFKRPVWITEFNYGKGTTRASFATQNDYLSTALPKILDQNAISGLFIYELYDQPLIRNQYPFEACYGLLTNDGTGTMVPKDAYTGYRNIVLQYKNTSK